MKSCKELVLLLVYIICIYTEKYIIIIVSYYTALYMIKREREYGSANVIMHMCKKMEMYSGICL